MKLLIDMNLSPAWVQVFQARGISAVHWSAIGKHDESDAVIFQWAIENDHVIFTHDLDFGMILAASDARKPSIIQVRYPNINPEKVGEWLADLILRHQEQLSQGALIAIEPGQHRIRLLPLDD